MMAIYVLDSASAGVDRRYANREETTGEATFMQSRARAQRGGTSQASGAESK
jgi:hypothetical protein